MTSLQNGLTAAQKAIIETAYHGMADWKTTGTINISMHSGITGLLFELNKGAKGGYVSPEYLREKLEQVIGALED